jgi:serine/threonine protein phosphatase 1
MPPISISVSSWIGDTRIVLGDTREFAIGDVHGHAEILEPLLDTIRDLAGGDRKTHLTYLGDLVDRGPESRRCLQLAARDARTHGVGAIHKLMGNHEIMMRRWIAGGELRQWFHNGGWATMASFGIDLNAHEKSNERETVRSLMASDGTLAMLEGMGTHRRVGQVLFVHAGINPKRRLDRFLAQPWSKDIVNEDDHWAWVREASYMHAGETFADGLVVCHGHVIEPWLVAHTGRDPSTMHLLTNGRLNLDGGSFASGIVTAAELQNGRYRVITASGSIA